MTGNRIYPALRLDVKIQGETASGREEMGQSKAVKMKRQEQS